MRRVDLARAEALVDTPAMAAEIARITAALPIGVRARQCPVRTIALGMLLTQADHRPAHLSRVHEALCALSEEDRRRLGVTVDWHGTPHQLTYRQVEYLNTLVETALGKDEPDGLAADGLQGFVDAARHAGLLCGLAGSLAERDIARLAPLGPDLLGFRGALCRDAARARGFDPERLRGVAAAMRRVRLDEPAHGGA